LSLSYHQFTNQSTLVFPEPKATRTKLIESSTNSPHTTTTMKTRSQSTGPAIIQVPSSDSSSPPSWRCNNQSRLHRGDEDCTASSPPSSPIIDTPAKRMTFERKRDARQIQDSQATTEPTPSRAANSRPRPQARTRGPVTSLVSPLRIRNLPTIHEDSSPEPARSNDDDDDDGFQSTQEEDRVPETPQNFPSSPPVPLPTLTADNLAQHNNQSISADTVNAPAAAAAASESACGLPPASIIVALPAYVTFKIAQLKQRSRIDALQHIAAQDSLVALQRRLEPELERARRSAASGEARGEAWEAAFVWLALLCLAYALWCFYNSVEFEFIEACRRAAYGL
jgi:hypothetical protein